MIYVPHSHILFAVAIVFSLAIGYLYGRTDKGGRLCG